MAKIVLTIHGMTNEKPGYSTSWYKYLNIPTEWTQGEYFWDEFNDNKWLGLSGALKLLVRPLFESLYYKAEMYSDVPKYSIGQIKKQAIEDLSKKIVDHIEKGDELILLAHSLGSVLTYEALCQADKYLNKKMQFFALQNIKLVTFGSPLTSAFERWFLNVHDYKIYPKLWINVSGKKDIVGGRNLKFSSFDGKKFGTQLWVDTTHSEFEYLEVLHSNKTFTDIFL